MYYLPDSTAFAYYIILVPLWCRLSACINRNASIHKLLASRARNTVSRDLLE